MHFFDLDRKPLILGDVIPGKKQVIVLVGFLVLFSFPMTALSDSSVSGNVTNTVSGSGLTNIANGEDSQAILGGAIVDDSRVSGNITNRVHSSNTVNSASGEDSVAIVGGTSISDSKIDGSIHNSVSGRNIINSAKGEDSKAVIGGTLIK